MRDRRSTALPGAFVALLLAGTALPARAEGSAATAADAAAAADAEQVRDNDDVIVNGVRERRTGDAGAKTPTPLIALAQTVSVIDEAELLRRNVQSINQALGYVAGIAPNQRGNVATRYDQLFIRGFSPAQFMDGMRLLGGVYASPQIDFHLVDRVDIIKGPASVLYGNSTPGGLVNLTSKVPYREAGGRIELAAGNFDLLRSSIDLNQPLDRDGKFLFRVIAGGERSDGFIARTGNRRYYARPMLTFAPDDRTSLTLILNYQRDPESASYSGVPVYGSALPNPNGPLAVDLNVSEPAYEAFDRTQKSATILFRRQLNDALTWTTNARYLDVGLHYRQIYGTFDANRNLDANGNTVLSRITRGGGGSDESFRTITFDSRMAAEFATGPVKHTLLAGVDWQNNRGSADQAFATGPSTNPAINIPDIDLYRPVYGQNLPSSNLLLFPGVSRTFRKIDQAGIYLQDQIAIGGLNLIASGRQDWYSTLTRNRVSGTVTRLSQSAFTGRVGALYETTFGLSPFVSYSESFEPQTGNVTILVNGVATAGESFVPVTGRQYEAGLKYQPRGANALFTLSLFDLRRQNVPAPDPNAGLNGIPSNAQLQIGEVKVRGIELDGRGDIAPGLSLTVAGTYNDARVVRGNNPVGTGDQLASVTGTRPLGVPTWSASSFVAYDLKQAVPGALGGFNIGGGVRYVGESDGTAQITVNRVLQTRRFASPGFVLADAVLGYDFGAMDARYAGLSFTVNAANLFDKRHIASCFFNNSCYFGASRTVVGTLRYAW
ncbi:TonB-dependent siderophore receptor [Sphingomonas adhaesiva]|uniref:TonB-dependent siderophore receptor n=1 Tax=Sphingomonas adhaesiva TaxID=28212 RepID=UPI002FF9CE8B